MTHNIFVSDFGHYSLRLLFFLSILLLVMSGHDGRYGCGTYVTKNKTKLIQIFYKAPSVKTTYKQSSGTGIPSHVPAQTLVHYILDLNTSTVSTETAVVVSPFQVKR